MNVLFMNTPKGEHCTADMIDDAIEFIINLNAEHYEMLFSQMSEKQRITFLAIAQEGRARNIYPVVSLYVNIALYLQVLQSQPSED